jgi:hypothetical protein
VMQASLVMPATEGALLKPEKTSNSRAAVQQQQENN